MKRIIGIWSANFSNAFVAFPIVIDYSNNSDVIRIRSTTAALYKGVNTGTTFFSFTMHHTEESYT